jgi:dihydrofolate reductase
MRTVTYGAACSLDGFITAGDGSIDWLHFSPDVREVMDTYWKGIDTIVMGRKTWEFAASQNSGDGSPYGAMKCYVFSRTLEVIARKGVELVADDAGGFVGRLKAQAGKGICVMGGSDFARSLFEADLIDEVGLNVHPILLGSGTPLFLDAGRRVALELTECRRLHGGCVFLNYKVAH